VLLFVKKVYADAIRNGTKTIEIRRGSRYSKIKVGDVLSINGSFSVAVSQIEIVNHASNLPFPVSDCYSSEDGPFYLFHLQPKP